MIVRCANCKQVHYPAPVVDLQQNIILWDNKGVRLAPREAEILFYMLEHRSYSCTDAQSIFDIHYAVMEATSTSTTGLVGMYLWRLKPRLASIGIEIVKHHAKWKLEWQRLSDSACAPLVASIE